VVSFAGMNLPGLIEIVPLEKPAQAHITVPGSKSITNRALILAALANGETILQGGLWSEDTQVMAEALRQLGFEVKVEPDAEEFSNRTITVKGLGGKIPNAGTESKPLEIFVGNAGTAARFLASLVCLGSGVYRLHGVPRMHERPQRALFSALRELGYKIDSPNDRLPAVIHASGSRSASCHVSIEESSQFASGLLLCAEIGQWRVTVTGENREESPYIAMTHKLIKAFPLGGGKFEIEGDASSGSYFVAAGVLTSERRLEPPPGSGRNLLGELGQTSMIEVVNWPSSGWQIDEKFSSLSSDRLTISRAFDLGDSIMTAIVLAPLGWKPKKFVDLGRLRLQECERVVALRTELMKCGAKVIEKGDTLEILPSALHGAEIETYNDHRMAMCFAILGLKIPGIKLRDPSCVKKTFPNFFQKLAAPPPQGLGVTVLDGSTKRKLSLVELFAG
jgi:3-phosphoshikimate 1-carboxyvinyltransferase